MAAEAPAGPPPRTMTSYCEDRGLSMGEGRVASVGAKSGLGGFGPDATFRLSRFTLFDARLDLLEARSPETEKAKLRALLDEYRSRCLWFLRPDWYPQTQAECLQALSYIERHGDLAGFRRARELREWLSPNSSDSSVA
jgi:hypothetical protein